VATTISDGTDTLTATIMDGYSAIRAGRNVVRRVLNSNVPAISLRPAALRRGRHRLVFESESVAEDAAAMLASAAELTLADTDRPNVGMTFVVPEGGDIRVELDDETRDAWIVEFDFQETD